MIQTDVLIIGAGVGGLSTAIRIAMARPELEITVLTKTEEGESNTRYAQGGVAAVWDLKIDSYKKHIADTLDAGDGLCDLEIVEIVVKEGPERVRDLIDWGARFDKVEEQYDLGREGGHSENRILHFKDLTGWEIQRTLLEKSKEYPNLHIYEHFFAVDLITQHHLGYTVTRLTPTIECYGAYALNKETNDIDTILARATVVATGGAGQVYRNTTNPVIASGDGIAMTYRAKGHIENMEFVQFHPTALYNPAGENPDFLVSEAVRGFGAILKTRDGEEFMHKYDPRKSLAPRDIVARAIDNEMKINGEDHMFLDCRHLNKEAFVAHFPTIYDKCISIGIDPMKDMIPVVPACHYMCGGIKVDAMGHSSISRMYACGECTCTGLHGANRLASNSLLEALVFGQRIAADVVDSIDAWSIKQGIPAWNAQGTTLPKEMVLITQSLKELKEVMSSYVGIVRSNVRLKRALDRLSLLYHETEDVYHHAVLSPQLSELRNLITIGYLVTRSASMRRESRGLHYTTDYPEQLPFIQDSIL
ncbi:MAG: L-aspartate oxidase [Lewinella sp.]|nr:L-aspartate oxidase [Lewinella sp.]